MSAALRGKPTRSRSQPQHGCLRSRERKREEIGFKFTNISPARRSRSEMRTKPKPTLDRARGPEPFDRLTANRFVGGKGLELVERLVEGRPRLPPPGFDPADIPWRAPPP